MKNNLLKTALLAGLGFCLALCYSAQAKKGSLSWYISPNIPINKSITAISPSLSAKCVTNIKDGQVTLLVNGQKRVMTPKKNSVNFPQINGAPQQNGRFAYGYTILWTVSTHQGGIFSLACEGDNHLNY